MQELLTEGFDYDLWANGRWCRSLGLFGDNLLAAQEVLEHILMAQKVWLQRCGVQVLEPDDNIALEQLFNLYCRAWQAQVTERSAAERITYETNDGRTFEHSLEQIARHVINHGTYHRGHLRGIASESGVESFPETDFVLFLRERGA